VTGGCGFIGSHVVDRLVARGDEVRELDDLSTGRPEQIPAGVELLVGDVADAETVRRAMDGVAGCIHLAAIASVARSNEDWLGTHRANLVGAITVFDAAAQACRPPVVYASSAAVYGDSATMPLSEDAMTAPLSAYGADKLGCELHARVAGLVHQVPTAGLRLLFLAPVKIRVRPILGSFPSSPRRPGRAKRSPSTVTESKAAILSTLMTWLRRSLPLWRRRR
jgi:UDP-glucose 4-epimerase